MSDDELSAKVSMLQRDVAELRRVDERHDANHARLASDTEHLKNQTKQLFEQQMDHGKMLLEHAKLHTQHAESIAAAKEQARSATQSATDLSKEWRDAAQAIDKHVTGVVGKANEQIHRLANAQEQSNLDREVERKADAEERALQTQALNKLVEMMKSPRIAAYVAIGAIVGGALMAILGKAF